MKSLPIVFGVVGAIVGVGVTSWSLGHEFQDAVNVMVGVIIGSVTARMF
jgi:hypothetical protein